jgi:hypothetical protein
MGYHEQRMSLHKKCAAAFASAALVLGFGSYKAFENVEPNKQTVETVDMVEGQRVTKLSREHTFESGSLVVGGIAGGAGSLTTALFSLASLGRYRRRARGEKTYEEHRADTEALHLQ